MKHEYGELISTSSQKVGQDLNKLFTNLLNGKLKVEGESVLLPGDLELEVKVRYKVTPEDDAFSVEISWEKPNPEENLEDD
ncbi:hypothetical protein [Candidatus Clostridium radicumherbarum]|uniref:Amphi-Trp domain-containing protein n=1 Tax=Candidatus Clostridium radicumherbarum TaxID=3381662 RepID=A0ABW8U205_9CLOT